MCFGQAAGGETAHPDARLLRRDSPRRRWAALSLPEVSHFDDDAMPEQMRQIVHCLYRLQVKAGILISKQSWRAGRRLPGAGVPQSWLRVS